MRRSRFLSAILLASGLLLSAVGHAQAATEAAFTQAAFAASQQAGKPVLVEITASWCPTCAQQRPILSAIKADPEFADLVVYTVDFDTQKDVVRAMGAQMQSTLIAFHGKAEKSRSTGDTNAKSIRALVATANQ